MDRSQKQQAVADLKEVFTTAGTVIVTHYRGLTVDEMNEFRGKARENGASVKVTKNTLAKIAANDANLSVLSEFLTGPTAITYSEDEVAAAKVAVAYAKDNEKLTIIGGIVNGDSLDESGIKQLASTPSLDESRGKIVGLLTASAAKLASVIQAPAGQVARTIGAYASKEA